MGITGMLMWYMMVLKQPNRESCLEGIGNNIVVTSQCKIKWDINCKVFNAKGVCVCVCVWVVKRV